MDRKKRLAWRAMWGFAALTLLFCILACNAPDKQKAQAYDSLGGLCGTFASIVMMYAMSNDKKEKDGTDQEEESI
jgi:succinate-acetate transporter protein